MDQFKERDHVAVPLSVVYKEVKNYMSDHYWSLLGTLILVGLLEALAVMIVGWIPIVGKAIGIIVSAVFTAATAIALMRSNRLGSAPKVSDVIDVIKQEQPRIISIAAIVGLISAVVGYIPLIGWVLSLVVTILFAFVYYTLGNIQGNAQEVMTTGIKATEGEKKRIFIVTLKYSWVPLVVGLIATVFTVMTAGFAAVILLEGMATNPGTTGLGAFGASALIVVALWLVTVVTLLYYGPRLLVGLMFLYEHSEAGRRDRVAPGHVGHLKDFPNSEQFVKDYKAGKYDEELTNPGERPEGFPDPEQHVKDYKAGKYDEELANLEERPGGFPDPMDTIREIQKQAAAKQTAEKEEITEVEEEITENEVIDEDREV